MSDETIYRIIDAFKANRKSVVRRSQYNDLVTHWCFAELIGLIRGLAEHKDGNQRWFIDGAEVNNDNR